MKIIIAGSRSIRDYTLVKSIIEESGFEIGEVVSGGAIGVDTQGHIWARVKNIRIEEFLPDWNLYGKKAGHIRNTLMADYADGLIAIWDGQSAGTCDIIKKMLDKKKPIFVRTVHA